MAATVEGAFVLIDRASGPLKKIEDQAKKTDAAIAGLGDRMDNVGTNNQMKQYEKTGKELREMERQAKKTGSGMESAAKQTDNLANSAEKAAKSGSRFRGTLLLMGGALAALLPVLIDVGGALGALVGSLGAATLGVGALGAALGGSLLVGLAGVAGAGLAAKKEMKGLKDEAKALQNQWESATKSGQADFVGMLADSMERAEKMLPLLANSSNRSMAAMRKGVDQFFERLDSPVFERFINTMTTTFEKLAGPIANSLANVGKTLAQIAIAAAPFTDQLSKGVVDMTKGWAQATSNTGRMRKNMDGWIDQAKSWKNLLGAAWDLTVSVFGSGKEEGQGLVDDMTRKIKQWNAAIQGNPGGMDDFWSESIAGTKELAKLIGSFTVPLKNLNDAMEPIVWIFENLATALNNLKIPGTEISGLTAAIVGVGATKAAGALGRLRGSLPSYPLWVKMVGAFGGSGSGMPSPSGGTAGRAGRVGGALMRGAAAVGRFAAPIGLALNAGSALSDVGSGDTTGALTTGVGTAAGAAIGAGLGSIIPGGGTLAGGMIGGALGGWAAKPVAGLLGIGGEDESGGNSDATLSLSQATKNLRKDRNDVKTATDRARRAEQAFNDVRRTGTRKAIVAEARLGIARRAVADASDRLRGSERTRGIVRVATKQVLKGEAGDARSAINTGRQDVQGAINDLAAANAGRGDLSQKDALAALNAQDQKLIDAKKKLSQVVLRATRQIGPKYAHMLKTMTPEALLGFQSLHIREGDKRRVPGRDFSGLFPGIDAPKVRTDPAPGTMPGNPLGIRGPVNMGGGGKKMKLPQIEPDKKLPNDLKQINDNIAKNSKKTNRAISDDTEKAFRQNRKSMVTQMKAALPELSAAYGKIKSETLSKLKEIGYSPSEATKVMTGGGGSATSGSGGGSGTRSGNPASGGGGSNPRGYAGGGRLGGIGNQDKVNMGNNNIGAPGELVVNQHTEADVNRDLAHAGKAPLGRRVAGENRPHYMPPPSRPRRHARGGALTSTHPELNPSMQQLEAQLAAKGFVAGSTTGGTHAPNSNHYTGSAIDYGNATNDMQRLWSVLRPQAAKFPELFGPSALQPGPTLMHSGVGFVDPALQSQHEDHIHVAMTGGPVGRLGRGRAGAMGGAAAPPSISIKGPKSRLKGTPGGFSQRGMDVLTEGMQAKVNKRLGAGSGVTAGNISGFGSINHVYAEHNSAGGDWSGEKLPIPTIASLAEAAGKAKGVDVPGMTMAQMTIGESNQRPGATGIDPGGTKGLGLWMITTGFNDATIAKYGGQKQMLNPVKNALAMADILKSSGQGAWYGDSSVTDRHAHFGSNNSHRAATGMRVPMAGWFGTGGSGQVSRPTMVGVGDGGKEHINITRQPAHKGTSDSPGGGGNLNIDIGQISVGSGMSKKQVQALAEKKIEEAMKELAEEIENGTGSGIV